MYQWIINSVLVKWPKIKMKNIKKINLLFLTFVISNNYIIFLIIIEYNVFEIMINFTCKNKWKKKGISPYWMKFILKDELKCGLMLQCDVYYQEK